MLVSQLTSDSLCFFESLEILVSTKYGPCISSRSKSIRDILDTLEGHLYKCYNSRGKYDHSNLKYHAPHMSRRAIKLRETMTAGEFLSITHREHAKPMKIIIKEIVGLSGQSLLDYVLNNVKSVTVLKEESVLLDKTHKTTMPDNQKIFSRFDIHQIEVVCRKKS